MNLTPEFTEHQLTHWGTKAGLLFAEVQLNKYGAVEGQDYCWRQSGEHWAIYVIKEVKPKYTSEKKYNKEKYNWKKGSGL